MLMLFTISSYYANLRPTFGRSFIWRPDCWEAACRLTSVSQLHKASQTEGLLRKKKETLNKQKGGGAAVCTLMNDCWPQGLAINATFLSVKPTPASAETSDIFCASFWVLVFWAAFQTEPCLDHHHCLYHCQAHLQVSRCQIWEVIWIIWNCAPDLFV